jgi:hypothetical protein
MIETWKGCSLKKRATESNSKPDKDCVKNSRFSVNKKQVNPQKKKRKIMLTIS